MGEREPGETTVSAETTRQWLKVYTKKILSEWQESDEVIKSPEEFKFETGSIDSITKRAAAGAISKALEKGEIYLFVNDKSFPKDKYFTVGFTKPYPRKDEQLLIAVIPDDFVSRAQNSGQDPSRVLEKCLEALVLSDIEAASMGRKRAIYKDK